MNDDLDLLRVDVPPAVDERLVAGIERLGRPGAAPAARGVPWTWVLVLALGAIVAAAADLRGRGARGSAPDTWRAPLRPDARTEGRSDPREDARGSWERELDRSDDRLF